MVNRPADDAAGVVGAPGVGADPGVLAQPSVLAEPGAVADPGGLAEPGVRPAATVMLIRDTAAGLEVFVLRRVAAMEFAAGMTVFPGGAVDAADQGRVDWVGPDPSWWSAQLGASVPAAGALVVGAVRELFEETGVLLASSPGTDVACRLSDRTRLDILDRRTTLPAALAASGLRLRADLLRPWANWITPPGRTRRYDTFFFAAALPAGQQAEMLTTEADLGQWRTPRELFAERDAGITALMPPTAAMLDDLAAFTSVADVMAAVRVVTPVRIRAGDFPGLGVGTIGARKPERNMP